MAILYCGLVVEVPFGDERIVLNVPERGESGTGCAGAHGSVEVVTRKIGRT
jgi:hypothetical protein